MLVTVHWEKQRQVKFFGVDGNFLYLRHPKIFELCVAF